ncbi:exo-alpha-sialidase [Trypanosoma cruzi]|nr:exo-alpha-sialidase [Trypanosoma cruzi]
MNGCRQEALTINMDREHAATQRRNTGGDDDREKSKKLHNTKKKNDRRKKHRQRPNPNQDAQTRTIAVLPVRGREDSALHTKNAHTASSHTPMDKNEKRHSSTASSSIPRPTGYGHSPTANTQRTRSELSKSREQKRGPHPSMTRRLTPCSHTECTISPIELILRPSLKDTSVSDGP